MSTLEVAASALRGPGGTCVLVDDVALADALVQIGCDILATGTSSVDPESLEVSGVELDLVVTTAARPIQRLPRPLTPGQVAYAVGSRTSNLSQTTGGALPMLARVARRVRGYEVAASDPLTAARAVLSRW